MITVEADKESLRAFEHNLKQLIAMTKEPVEDILKQQGRLFAKAAAKHTERYGDKAAVGTKHKDQLTDDVRRIYKRALSAQGLIARKFGIKAGEKYRNYIRRRDTAKAQDMVTRAGLEGYYRGRQIKVITWDGGNAHTRAMKGGKSKDVVHLVCEYPQVKKYITSKKRSVGAAKYGWVKAAKMLGHKGTGAGFPAWFSKGHRTRGFGRVRGTGSKAELTVAHYGKYGFSKTSMSGLFRHRTNMMAKQIERMIKAGNRDAAKARRMSFRRTKLIIR